MKEPESPTINQPLPHQLTVGKLRRILESVPDEVVVGLTLPPGFPSHPELSINCNLVATYSGGPVISLSPQLQFANVSVNKADPAHIG